MPRVTVRKSQGPQISDSPVRGGQFNVQTSEETFGGGSALKQANQALQNTTDTLIKVESVKRQALEKEIARQKSIADKIAADEGDLFASKLESDILSDVKKMQGKDAGGAVDIASEKWKKGISEYRSTLTNDEQKIIFDEKVRTREASLYGKTQNHMSTEWQKYQVDHHTAYIENERANIAQDYSNLSLVQQSFANIESKFNDLADIKGLGAQEREKGLREEIVKAHNTVIDTALDEGNFEYAEKYYDANKSEIEKSVGKDIEKQIKAKKEDDRKEKERILKEKQSNTASNFWFKHAQGKPLSLTELRKSHKAKFLSDDEFKSLLKSQTTSKKTATPEEKSLLIQDISTKFFNIKDDLGEKYSIRDDASYEAVSDYRASLSDAYTSGAISESAYQQRLQMTEAIFQQGPEGDKARAQFKYGKQVSNYVNSVFTAMFGAQKPDISNKIMDMVANGELSEDNVAKMSKQLALEGLRQEDPKAATLEELPNSVSRNKQLNTINIAPTKMSADRNITPQKTTIDDYNEGDTLSIGDKMYEVYVDKSTGKKRGRLI